MNSVRSIASYSGVVFGLAIMAPLNILSVVSIILGVISLIVLFPFSIHKNKTALFMILLVALMAIGIFFSEDARRASAITERSLSLALFPLLLILGLHAKLKLKNPFIGLTIGVVISSFICLILASWRTITSGSFYNPVHETHFIYHHFYHQNLSGPLSINATYLAHAAVLSALYLLQLLLSNVSKFSSRKTIAITALLGYLLVIIFLCKSVMAVIALLVGIGFFIFFHQDTRAFITRNKGMAFAFFTGLLSICIWVAYSKFQVFDLSFDYANPFLRPLQIRLAIWQSAWLKIADSPLLGYGTGDSLRAMLDSYSKNNFKIGLENSFNAHNTYLELWLQLGIIGPLLFILSLFTEFASALKRNVLLQCCAIIIIGLFSLSESVLLTYRGIALTCFCLFLTNQNSYYKTGISENSTNS